MVLAMNAQAAAKPIAEISVIILAYNDMEIVEGSIRYVVSTLTRLAERFEVIVVEDCSTDGTREIVQRLEREIPEVRPIYHAQNRGIGDGLRDGFQAARYDLVCTNCADLPFDVADLAQAVPFMQSRQADVCVMVRHDRSANSNFRKLTSYVNYCIIKLLFNIPIHDYNFVQMYKRQVCQSIKLHAKDVFVPPELIIRSYEAGYKIVEFRATFHPRQGGRSKYGHIKHFIRTLKDQILFWYLLRVKKQPHA
jgi:glycosyltransferase involved in cell wall biosynthesis